MYSGIPGTSSLIPNEGIMMFNEERGEIDAQAKIVEAFKEIHETFLGSAFNPRHAPSNHPQNSSKSNGRSFQFTNDYEQHGQLKKKQHSEANSAVDSANKKDNIINPGDSSQNSNKLLTRSLFSHLSNEFFMKFKVFEMMQSKNGGSIEINKSLIKKIQNISNQQTYFSIQGSNHQTQG